MKNTSKLFRDILLFPDQLLLKDSNKEVVIAFPSKILNKFNLIIKKSKFISNDKRDIGNTVGFIKRNIYSSYTLLQKNLWEYGIVDYKYNVNRIKNFSKFVICLCLKVKRDKKFLFIPRGNKKVLPDTLALGPMKSILVTDLISSFHRCISYRRKNELHFLDQIKFTGNQGVFQDVLNFDLNDIVKCGFVGGGKDFVLVLILEYDLPVLEVISSLLGGIVLDISKYNYTDINDYYGLGIDGWSDAILKYFNY